MILSLLATDPDYIHVECDGEISQVTSANCEPLSQLVGESCFAGKVMLNLAKATFLDSSGVGWLVQLQKKFNEAGGLMVLHSAPPLLGQVLQLLKMHTLLHIAADEAAARAIRP